MDHIRVEYAIELKSQRDTFENNKKLEQKDNYHWKESEAAGKEVAQLKKTIANKEKEAYNRGCSETLANYTIHLKEQLPHLVDSFLSGIGTCQWITMVFQRILLSVENSCCPTAW